MPVTLYRCSVCMKLFNTVIQGRCRGCKTGDYEASVPGVESTADIKIIEGSSAGSAGAITLNPNSGQPEFFVDKKSNVDAINELTRKLLEESPSLGLYAGPGATPKPPFKFALAPGGTIRFRDQYGELGPVYENRSANTVRGKEITPGRLALDYPLYYRDPSGTVSIVDMMELPGAVESVEVNSTEPVAESDPTPDPAVQPHAAMLNPSRKMRVTE